MIDGTDAQADRSLGAFSLDTTLPGAVPRGFDAFLLGWRATVGDDFPQPTYSSATKRDFRVKTRVAKVRDATVVDVHGVSVIQTAGAPGGGGDQVRLHVVRRGGWTLSDPRGRSEHTISAGQFLLRHVGQPSHFTTMPHTTSKFLVLPATTLKPLIGNRALAGPADTAEVRLLVAHAKMVQTTMPDLGPAGVQAAHSTLVELAKAVARRRFDDREPQLAPALVQAAKDLADSRLADPELSSAMLARELNVSVRTLQRAFAAAGESVTAHIRLRRLDEARLALTAPSGRPTVSELAVHWQFADSSHFIRAFKKRYGQTPAEYRRSTAPTRNRTDPTGSTAPTR